MTSIGAPLPLWTSKTMVPPAMSERFCWTETVTPGAGADGAEERAGSGAA
ncbi:hypothetical protein [Rathayibacter sp. AY1D1]|nr:hypothetical protein [Rathayibacter sp. AY1D1]